MTKTLKDELVEVIRSSTDTKRDRKYQTQPKPRVTSQDFISDYIATKEDITSAIYSLSKGYKKEAEFKKTSGVKLGSSPVRILNLLEDILSLINKMIQYRSKNITRKGV